MTESTPLGPPSAAILSRFHAGAARYAEFKRLLHEHREDALTCYDHPGHYCCVCGEHVALGYQEHLAAVLAKRAGALVASTREQVALEIEAAARNVTHAYEEPFFVDAALVARGSWDGAPDTT